MKFQKTRGLIAAPFTPMESDGRLNLAVLETYARWLHQSKVVGAFICGTTGEGNSLTLAERRQVAECWMAIAPKGLRVIVHVGYAPLADCRILASHAASIGADGIACMAPPIKTFGVSELADWCEQIAAAAPLLPFYYYHMPSVSGVNVKVAALLRLVAPRIPNFAGVKYTYEDLEDYAECLHFDNGRYDVLFGRDELLLAAVSLGARGAVGSTYNFAAPLYYELIAAFDRGDKGLAADLQAQAIRMITTCVGAGPHPVATFKWLMRKTGVDCGPSRPPLVDLTFVQATALDSALQTAGAYKWISRTRRSDTVATAVQ